MCAIMIIVIHLYHDNRNIDNRDNTNGYIVMFIHNREICQDLLMALKFYNFQTYRKKMKQDGDESNSSSSSASDEDEDRAVTVSFKSSLGGVSHQ